jgi:predicted peptidase
MRALPHLFSIAIFATVVNDASAGGSDRETTEADNTTGATLFAENESLQVIPTRRGVSVSIAISKPRAKPIASVILFSGGNGNLKLSKTGFGAGADNFLVRTRQQFVLAGYLVAISDAPSDRRNGLDGFRTSDKHAEDVKILVSWLSARWLVPIYLIGTSRGTISACNAVARSGGRKVAGLILTASVTAGNRETLDDVALERIKIPTLLVHHRQDTCHASPYQGAQALLKRLAGQKEMEDISGGDPLYSHPCGSLSQHGFLGVESQVVQSIVEWIGRHSGRD